MTKDTRAFIDSVPKGAWYVLSAESPGPGFTGDVARQAKELTKANFERLATHRGPERSGGAS